MIHRRCGGLSRLIEDSYPDPLAFMTAEGFARACHEDVYQLSDPELEDERLLSRLRRSLSPLPSRWLLERIAVLDQEIARRRRARART